MDKILITGANGQIGSVLTNTLIDRYGSNHIIASDLRNLHKFNCQFEVIDATDFKKLEHVVKTEKISQIFHLAAILSAKGESNPLWAWNLNMTTLTNVLKVATENLLDKVFFPSTIAVFGNHAPKEQTPQQTFLAPGTAYGISKVAGELWANYYFQQFRLDVRSLRYPGIIGYQSLPGGGTTDYAVDVFHKAIQGQTFSCFLDKNTSLPMMYMPDAIDATIQLMEAPKSQIKTRTSYNISAMSFTPEELFQKIKTCGYDFDWHYVPDHRQNIANSWPASIDDTQAREDWGWTPKWNLDTMVSDMLAQLKKQILLKTV